MRAPPATRPRARRLRGDLCSLQAGFCDCSGDLLIFDTVLAKAFRERLQLRAFETLEVLAQPLTDVRAHERLVATEPQCRRDLLQVLDDILRHAETDRRHRAVALKSLLDSFTHRLHRLS